jgi:hypothetical protein
MGREPMTPITEELGREICQRAGAEALLGGTFAMLVVAGREADRKLDREVNRVERNLDGQFNQVQRDVRSELDRRLPTPTPSRAAATWPGWAVTNRVRG